MRRELPILFNTEMVTVTLDGTKTDTSAYVAQEVEMLTLQVKKKWFDMILSGEKKEEYREIKPYYDARFLTLFGCIWVNNELIKSPLPELQRGSIQKIVFRNGYGKSAPTIIADCELKAGEGRGEWGAEPGKQYYILAIKHIVGGYDRAVIW